MISIQSSAEVEEAQNQSMHPLWCPLPYGIKSAQKQRVHRSRNDGQGKIAAGWEHKSGN